MTDDKIPYPHVELREGRPFVAGTKVPVYRLWRWHRQGTTFETLMKRYPQLPPAKILTAVAFAYDNQELMLEEQKKEEAGAC